MTQAGQYQVWLEMRISGQLYRGEVSITVLPIGGSNRRIHWCNRIRYHQPQFTDPNLFDAWMIPNGDVTSQSSKRRSRYLCQHNRDEFLGYFILLNQERRLKKGIPMKSPLSWKTEFQEVATSLSFAEASPGTPKLLEEHVSLNNIISIIYVFFWKQRLIQTTGMIGVFLGANLPGANPGSVIIDAITMVRNRWKTRTSDV